MPLRVTRRRLPARWPARKPPKRFIRRRQFKWRTPLDRGSPATRKPPPVPRRSGVPRGRRSRKFRPPREPIASTSPPLSRSRRPASRVATLHRAGANRRPLAARSRFNSVVRVPPVIRVPRPQWHRTEPWRFLPARPAAVPRKWRSPATRQSRHVALTRFPLRDNPVAAERRRRLQPAPAAQPANSPRQIDRPRPAAVRPVPQPLNSRDKAPRAPPREPQLPRSRWHPRRVLPARPPAKPDRQPVRLLARIVPHPAAAKPVPMRQPWAAGCQAPSEL